MIYFVIMNLELIAASNNFQLHYKEHHARIKLTDDVIVSYLVDLTLLTISKIENTIEEKLNNLNLINSDIKKIFYTCVELIQNQFLYGISDNSNTQNKYFIISKNGNCIKIISANLIQTSQVNYLKNKIATVNSYSNKDELKSYYLHQLANNEFGEKGGAGLGFITLALKSKNLLQTEFQQIDDIYSIFILNINFDITIQPKMTCPLFDGFNI